MRKVVGLDISTCTGMAMIGGEEVLSKVVDMGKFKAVTGFARYETLASEIGRVLDVWKPELAIIEVSMAARNAKTSTVLLSCATLIKSVLFRSKVPWIEVRPSTLKQWASGKGNAKKPEMAKAAELRWGFSNPSDDIIDAYCLAQMGQLPIVELLQIKGVTIGYGI